MPAQDNVTKQLRINAIIKGIILGVVLLASSIFSYYLITKITVNPLVIIIAPNLFAYIIPFVVTVLFSMNMQKNLGGYWNLRQAVTAIFMMLFTSYLFLIIGRDLIFKNLIEPNMIENTQAVMIKTRSQTLKTGGESQTQINKEIADMREGFAIDKKNGVGGVIQGVLITIILLFTLSVILAAIFKKEPPYIAEIVSEKISG